MSLSLNPAGLVDVGRQFQVGAALFAPFRSYDATGSGFADRGSHDSDTNYFVVPNLAYSSPIDANSAWGVALFGNGGMNTSWPGMARSGTSSPCPPRTSGTGVFCDGKAGVDLMQAFLAFGYAHRFGNFSVGVSPVLAIQRFRAYGLRAFGLMGVSSDAAHLTDNGYEFSYGGGVRVGAQWSVAPNFRVGLSGQSPMWMTKFSDYAGLFAEDGSFDIPGNVTAGIAWDAMPNLTLMADYKHIFYGSVASIANSSAITGPPCLLGSSCGPGFGWHDVDIVKLGVEWRATPVWTLRAGYAHNTNPIKSTDVMFNILAPGVVTDHITGGFAYKMSPNSTLEFAAAYVPSQHVSGPDPFGAPGSTIDISMHQYQFTVGWTYQFDAAPAPKGLITK